MLAQLLPHAAEFLSKVDDKVPKCPPSAALERPAQIAALSFMTVPPLNRQPPKLTCYNQSFPHGRHSPVPALRYNVQRVAPSQVVTQPYDKITPAMQERYYAASPYNLVRIILGRREPSDNTVENVYSRAAAYRQRLAETRRSPAGFRPVDLCLLTNVHIPNHRRQARAPRIHRPRTRRRLLRQGRLPPRANPRQAKGRPPRSAPRHPRPLRAAFYALRRLRRNRFPARSQVRHPSHIDVTDEYGVANRVWQISDPAVIAAVQKRMTRQKADYRRRPPPLRNRTELTANERNRGAADAPVRERHNAEHPKSAPYEFAMMTFVNMNDPGSSCSRRIASCIH